MVLSNCTEKSLCFQSCATVCCAVLHALYYTNTCHMRGGGNIFDYIFCSLKIKLLFTSQTSNINIQVRQQQVYC